LSAAPAAADCAAILDPWYDIPTAPDFAKHAINRLRVGSSQIDALDALFFWQDTVALIYPTH